MEPRQIIQLTIVVGMLILMALAIIIDGEIGIRVFGMLLASFGLILGYFFRKAQYS